MTSTSQFMDAAPARRRSKVLIRGPQADAVAATLWILVTFVQFSGDELLLYPLAIYFSVRAWIRRNEMAWLMSRSVPIMIFPLWCLISPIWAVEPMEAANTAIYLMLTLVICYVISLSLEPRHILYAVLIATGAVGLLNLLNGLATGRMVPGLFPHKNMLGTNMVVLWTAALAVALDRGAPRRPRIAALLLAALGLYLVSISGSATAIILMIVTGTGLIIAARMLQGDWRHPVRLALICIALAFGFAVASVLLVQPLGDLFGLVLERLGKDRSLTGRTELWAYAEDQIREHPILGVGHGGFWRYHESVLVRRIHFEFYKGPRTTFNFHNSFYEIAVHQGLIGLGMTLAALAWAFGWILRGALKLASMPAFFFLVQSLAVVIRSLSEADFYKPFVLFHMLLWIGALAVMRQIRNDQLVVSAEPLTPVRRPNLRPIPNR